MLLLHLLLLVIILQVVHGVHLHRGICLFVLLHDLEVHLIVDLEALGFNLLLPVVIMDLNIV